MKRKLTPERREHLRRLHEEADVAMERAMRRAEAYLQAREDARERERLRRERSLFRRLNPFRRAA